MKESKADLILHPLRLRIIQALVGERNLTAQQLVEALKDVPPATLYRHLKRMENGGVVEVVEQRQIRGAVEKVYGLPTQSALSAEEFASITPDEHLRYFMNFLMSLYSDFGRYVSQDEFDLVKDGVSYRQVPLYFDDEEYMEFLIKLRALFNEGFQNQPRMGRRRRLFTTIVLPEDN